MFKIGPKIPSKIGKLGTVLFFASLASAFVGSVIAIYVNSFVNSEALTGFIFTGLVLVAILSNFLIIPIVESKSKTKIFIYSGIMVSIGYFLYSVVNNLWLFLLIACFVTILTSLRIAAGGLLIEHSSTRKNLSKNEGFVYTIQNISWALGPLSVGFILAKLDVIRNIFILAALFMIFSIILFFIFKFSYSGKKKKININPFKNFKDFFKEKNRVKAYILSGGLNFWWGLIYIYMPLLIIKNLNDSWVGFFLFFIVVPLISLEYYFGKLAGKKGYKKIFTVGFLIPAAASLLCFFFFSNIWFIIISLSLASIGLAMTEGTTEAYFFDILNSKEDSRFYSPYNTAIDVGSLFGEFIPALMLLFLPFKSIFLFYGAGMLILGLLALTIKDVFEFKRKGVF